MLILLNASLFSHIDRILDGRRGRLSSFCTKKLFVSKEIVVTWADMKRASYLLETG